jgi:putative ABC transport system substrate-binding protein
MIPLGLGQMAIGIGRRQFITALGGTAVTWPLAAHGQQPAMPVVGFLCAVSSAAVAPQVAAFLAALKEAGYVDGQNVAIEYRWAEGHYDRLPSFAADLVRHQAAVIVTLGDAPAALAAKAATSSIPILFIVGSDPVKLGLVASLNGPGGNATGVNLFIAEMEAKRLELLHELVPTATKLAVLVNPNAANAEAQLSDVRSASQALGLQIEVIDASNEAGIDAGFAGLAQRNVGGLTISADPFFNNRREQLIALAARYAIPTVYFFHEFPQSGGLISYGTSLTDAYRQVGVYTAKILGGLKPSDLPVMQPTKFELVINLKTAKVLGIIVPQILRMTADEVIE